ncbi:phage terminase small subunit P27 family [Siccirubricoccus sp. KC 17139]|uniref:Phage terminase small subunit P27 family n=1 Tax=Siccirubricoccus soli TaxID=2899147 RepID=A0ABT1D0J3_9PROT|nr:phage terminase small subunit P27 family [Siccirubricoccus soli]MCO6414805.1 phage terminase small subunit P27 family [Siccirubricoccus soli]MCP2680935.1 phage terminase small subunit P27 family [Siccirubricoccus soli]
MAGRPRKPTAIKELHGTLQPCRTNPLEPKPQRGFPVPPSHLTPEEVKAWNEICQAADSMGVLTLADVFVVEEAAVAKANLLSLRKRIRDEGDVYTKTDIKGEVMQRANPLVAMEQTARRDFLTLLTKFGFSPADRARVSTKQDDGDEDDLSLWIK